VDVAAHLFRERGYNATSMQDIADAVGLLKGSVYHYIRTKEDLLWAILEPSLRTLVDNARDILQDDAPLTDRIRRAIAAHAQSFAVNQPHMSVLTQVSGSTLSAPRRRAYAELRTEYEALWREAIASGVASGELRSDVAPDVAVLAILGMLNWMFRWFRVDGEFSADEIAANFGTIVVDGLRTPA
jgi:AcrR family transcriptional regulator